MATRPTTTFLALALALAAAPVTAAAQVAAPRLVEEGDEAEAAQVAPEPWREPVRSAAPHAPPTPTSATSTRTPTSTATPTSSTATATATPTSSTATATPTATSTATPGADGGADAALPAPPPPPTTAADLARRIIPVQTSYARLMELWTERRTATREADAARAEHAQRALVAAKRELGIENLPTLAAAEIREAERALASNLPAEAVARATLAVELAPDLPDAHLVRARALLAHAPGSPRAPLAAVGEALAAAAREPRSLRAFQGDLASAALAAIFTAAIATVLLLFLRRVRLFLHDFHHLPLLRGAAPVQAGFVALVLLAIPIALGAGPAVLAAVALLAVWLYLGLAERLVATAALLALVALPWAAGAAARATAWTGSLAEQVHDVEQGALSDAEAAAVEAGLEGRPAPAALYAALGRHHKRRGDLDAALRFYALAAAADDRAPELQVNVGNVLFLKGDLDGAKAAYLGASDRAGTDLVVLGAAHYGLSKLYLRTSDMEKSAAAREKAEREAGAFLRRFGSDDDFSANRYLVDVPVPERKVRALAAGDGSAARVEAWVRRRVAGSLPRGAWPWAPLGTLAGLWALALLSRRLAPAAPCERCGGAACRRCDASAAEQCGQCVNVFLRKGVVDARDRLRKEAQVRRHLRLRHHLTRILALVGGGAGQLADGAPVKGALLLVGVLFAAFVVWFWRGLMPPPLPSPYVLVGKLLVAAPLGLAVWALAVRDAFRRTSE